jgi:hypothetical protein
MGELTTLYQGDPCSKTLLARVYILKNTPPPQRGGISADVIWGKNMKRGREKRAKCKRKRKKGEIKQVKIK